MPIKDLNVSGGSTQETRSGKNKLNVPSNYILTGNEDIVLNLAIGDYVISWEEIITEGTNNNMLMIFYYEDSTEYTRYISPSYASKQLTLNATKNIVKVKIYSQNTYNNSVNITTTFKNLMISTEGGDYEQYGASPSPNFPSPIKSVGNDVNLLNIYDNHSEGYSIAKSGLEFTFLNNGGIKLNGMATSNVSIDLIGVYQSENYKLKFNNKYIASGLSNGISLLAYDGTNKFCTFENNISQEVKNQKMDYMLLAVAPNINFNNLIIYPKLQKGTVATAYSEHGKGTVTIEKSGKNEFNINSEPIYRSSNTDYSKLDNGVRVIAKHSSTDTGFDSVTYKLKDLTNYVGSTVRIKCNFKSSGENAGTYIVGLCNKDGTSRQTLQVSLVSGQEISFIVPELTDKTYLAVWFYVRYNTTVKAYDYVDYTDIIVTIDNEDMTYEPYFHDTYTVPLDKPLRSLPNGVKDELKSDGIHKRVGRKIFDGTETWTLLNKTYYIAITDKRSNTSIVPNALLSNQFLQTPRIEGTNDLNLGKMTETYYSGGNTNVFFNYDNGIGGVENWKNYLAEQYANGTPVILDYELAKPVMEELTEEQQEIINSIKTEKGTTYFRNLDDAEMEIEYYKDLQLLFDKVVSE